MMLVINVSVDAIVLTMVTDGAVRSGDGWWFGPRDQALECRIWLLWVLM